MYTKLPNQTNCWRDEERENSEHTQEREEGTEKNDKTKQNKDKQETSTLQTKMSRDMIRNQISMLFVACHLLLTMLASLPSGT